jgi:hypothetical protein
MKSLQRAIQTCTARTQPFRMMKGGQKRAAASIAKQAIDRISGQDSPALLVHLLTAAHNAAVLKHAVDSIQLPVIVNIRSAVAAAPDHLKPMLLSIVAPCFTNAQLTAMHFTASPRSLAHARSHAHEHGPGSMLRKPIQPASKQPTATHVQSALRSFLMQHSKPAANQTGKVKCGKQQPAVPIYHLDASIKELHRMWMKEGKHTMVYSTFRQQVKRLRQFEQARKQTDMCDLCVSGKQQELSWMRHLNKHAAGCDYANALKQGLMIMPDADNASLFDLPDVECKCEQRDAWKQNDAAWIECSRIYRHHYHLAKSQRQLFTKQAAELKHGQAQLILDFKENVWVNRGPVEVSDNYYNHSLRSVLGCRLVWMDEAGNAQKKYIDCVSMVLNKDAAHAIDCLYRVVEQHVLPLNVNDLFVWNDTGKHFRCAEFAYAVLQGLRDKYSNIGRVEWNIFIEHHGKSPVDAHFSLLSRWLKEAEQQRRIDTTEQLIAAWEERARQHQPSHSISFIHMQPSCGHDHEQTAAISSSSTQPVRIDAGKVDCKRPIQQRCYLSIPNLNTCYHYRSSSISDSSSRASRNVGKAVPSTVASGSAVATCIGSKGGKLEPSGSPGLAIAGSRQAVRADAIGITAAKQTKEEAKASSSNTNMDSSVEAHANASIDSDAVHSIPSSIRVVSQVVPSSDWRSKSILCEVSAVPAPSIIQLAPRIHSKPLAKIISKRHSDLLRSRLKMHLDVDGDVVMEDAVVDVFSIDSSFASTVHVKQERNNNGNKRHRNIAMHDDNNFTISSLSLLSLASVASSSRPASLSIRRSARQQQQQDNDMALALLLQSDENEHADLMYD